jgi:LmbE family N-acetylglucosaminyl deacetylase
MEAPILSDISVHQGVTLLVIRPHLDDESSATGGMLAHYHRHGVRTGVVLCTGGDEGEILDSDLSPVVDFPRLRDKPDTTGR